FQPSGFGDGVFASVRFKIAYGDVFSLPLELLRLLEHAERLSNARRIAEKHAEMGAAFGLPIPEDFSAGGGRRRHRSLPRNELCVRSGYSRVGARHLAAGCGR